MNRYTLSKISLLVATTIGIASVATPVSATPGYYTGLVGSVCAATKSDFPKISVGNAGAIYNKNTSSSAVINCATPIELFTIPQVWVTYIKKDSGTLSCTFHRRSFDYLSGATNSASTTSVGSSYLYFSGYQTDYFNSVQCTIPKAGVSGQSGVNAVLWAN